MILIVYTETENISMLSGNALSEMMDLEECIYMGMDAYSNHNIMLVNANCNLLNAEQFKDADAEMIIFMGRHRSSKGVSSFTSHATGNFTGNTEYGGLPNILCKAEPRVMLSLLRLFGTTCGAHKVTYEATHHGPFAKAPVVFAEFGGSEFISARIEPRILAEAVKNAVYAYTENRIEYKKAVIGFSGSHYPDKFTKLALEKGYAFSHIFPEYAMVNNGIVSDMIEQAIYSTTLKNDNAVIEWKGFNSKEREVILKKLENLGMDYERV
jgi:D-aminoacyl-tRNA deacylase